VCWHECITYKLEQPPVAAAWFAHAMMQGVRLVCAGFAALLVVCASTKINIQNQENWSILGNMRIVRY